MKKRYINFLLIILVWFLTLVFSIIWSYENPDKVEGLKSYFKEKDKPIASKETTDKKKVIANSFSVEYSKVISLSEKTAFITNDNNFEKFEPSNVTIYTQNGYVLNNLVPKKLKLSDNFTLRNNGGIKTVFFHNENSFALISSSKNKCFYASIISLVSGQELFKTGCLPDVKKIDFNGLGSSNIHINDKIYLSLGAPEQFSSQIALLAQNKESKFGKVLIINKPDLENQKILDEGNLNLEIFTSGHRNPQGMAKIKNVIFSVEHGPKGGDELNKLMKDKNYGWPAVSYGSKYLYDDGGKSYQHNHEANDFMEPLFALVPSIGISSLASCPSKLKNFYKKNCLLALSLRGNNLRPGKSLIIFLLDEQMQTVQSVEKINLDDDLRLRHFVTSSQNELYEDDKGNIYLSADKKGIYKIEFTKFR